MPMSAGQNFDNYRNYVGSEDKYDLIGAMQFNLLTALGLRESHRLLDIGCGSLRAGRLFIPYLLAGHYFGVEPNRWLLDAGIDHHLGQDMLRIKAPTFSGVDDFDFSGFAQTFDFILAQSIFTHASAKQIKTCLAGVRRVLKPGGLFVVNYVEGPVSYAGDEWVYPGMVAYSCDDLNALAMAEGLVHRPIDWPHPNGLRWALIYDGSPLTGLQFIDGSDRVIGNFDGAGPVSAHLWQLHGWAFDRETSPGVERIVLLDADGRLLAQTEVGRERPDVAATFDDAAALGAGWCTTISTATLLPGRQKIRAYAVIDDRAFGLGVVDVTVTHPLQA